MGQNDSKELTIKRMRRYDQSGSHDAKDTFTSPHP
jgi:hypothetical protein